MFEQREGRGWVFSRTRASGETAVRDRPLAESADGRGGAICCGWYGEDRTARI